MSEEKKHNCDNCPWRAKYDENPKSFLGILWKWHTFICPGWKSYQKSLAKSNRN